MAETQQGGLFTNTRLMVAGIVFGLVGVMLAFWVIDSKVQESTGGTTEICYLKQNLDVGEKLTANHVGFAEVPKRFAGIVDKMVKRDKLPELYEGRLAVRRLYAGEVLSVYEFAESLEEQLRPKPRNALSRMYTTKVDSENSPGQSLKVGSVVDLWARFNFSERVFKGRSETVQVLERVRVMAINGSYKAVSRVANVTLDLSPTALEFLQNNRKYMVGDMFITSRNDAVPTEFNKEIHPDALAIIQDNAALPAEKAK